MIVANCRAGANPLKGKSGKPMSTTQALGDDLVREQPVLAEAGGRTFDGYLARPATGSGPGLIIVTEMWGTTQLNRDMADSYARRGWCALVPSMFWQAQRPGTFAAEGPERDMAWERLRAYDFDRGAQDVRTAADWLRGSPFCSGKVAVIGFCMGGRTAVLACARCDLDAGIAVYALGIRHHLDEVARINCPVQLHYGLADVHISRAEIDEVMAATRGRPNITNHLYEGAGHGFFNPLRPAHDAAATALAKTRIDDLLQTLR
jgi:carboxymethylenebutenolidase